MVKLLRWKSGTGRRRQVTNITAGRQGFFTRDVGPNGQVIAAHILVTATDGNTYQLVVDKEQFDQWVDFVNN